MKIIPSQTMALAVDYQVRLLPSIDNADFLLKRLAILLRGLRLLDIPILITQQYTRGLGMSHSAVFESAGTTEYLEKRTFSCCGSESILQAIDRQRRPQIILCGIEAHICVLQTALDLLEKGFQVIFVRDCISSRHAYDREAAFERLARSGAVPATAESLLFELMETADHPRFKDISHLVKSKTPQQATGHQTCSAAELRGIWSSLRCGRR